MFMGLPTRSSRFVVYSWIYGLFMYYKRSPFRLVWNRPCTDHSQTEHKTVFHATKGTYILLTKRNADDKIRIKIGRLMVQISALRGFFTDRVRRHVPYVK